MAARLPSCEWPAARRQAGFTYLALLIAIAIIGMVAASAVQVGSLLHRREAEEALLAAGRDFSAALASYAKATPAGLPTAPATLQDLLRDPRFPGTLRHLRHIPADPLSGQRQWGLLKTADGQRIVGLYSLAPGKPIKLTHFGPQLERFNNALVYADWVFMAPAVVAQGQPVPAPATAQPAVKP